MKNVVKINLPFNDNSQNDYLILGHFNVIHKGHYNLFKELKSFSFFIFENNPSKLFRTYNLNERINNINRFDPKTIYVYDILKSNLDSIEFIEKVLKKINFKTLVAGSDFRFGKNRVGDVELLKKYFDVKVIKKDNYSTTQINNYLINGQIEQANEMLVYNFYYENEVVKGKQLARKLFKPTANIIDEKSIDLLSGSYCSMACVDNKFYKSISFIGIPKSFEDNKSYVETHIMDFDQEIYGKTIKVYPLSFIRKNEKFNDIKDLEKAIWSDYKKALKYFESFDIKKFRP